MGAASRLLRARGHRRAGAARAPQCRPAAGARRHPRRRWAGDRARSGDAAARRVRLSRRSGSIPNLLLAQTCWGPMEQGLAEHVSVVGQPSYDGFEGGQGELYSSAILMRREPQDRSAVTAPADGDAASFRSTSSAASASPTTASNSMSGIIAPTRDLEAMGESLGHLLRAHRDRRASRLDRRGRRGQGGCLRDRLPQLAHGAAPRAGGQAEVQVVGWTGMAQGPADDHLAAHAAGDRRKAEGPLRAGIGTGKARRRFDSAPARTCSGLDHMFATSGFTGTAWPHPRCWWQRTRP